MRYPYSTPEEIRQENNTVPPLTNKRLVHSKQLSMHDFVACGSLQAMVKELPSTCKKGKVETFIPRALDELDNVVYLPKHVLSDAERSVLKDGLCPTPVTQN